MYSSVFKLRSCGNILNVSFGFHSIAYNSTLNIFINESCIFKFVALFLNWGLGNILNVCFRFLFNNNKIAN